MLAAAALAGCGGGGGGAQATTAAAQTDAAAGTTAAGAGGDGAASGGEGESAGESAGEAAGDAAGEAEAGLASEAGAEAAASSGAEKVVRMSRSWENTSWDPAQMSSTGQIVLGMAIFETLVALADGGSVRPLLAESWEGSGDGLSYTFTLRPNVTFHKGYGRMTSDDVKFTFERQLDPEVASIHAESLKLDNIDSIEAPDDLTVVFHLKAPDPDFVNRCAGGGGYILSRAACEAMGLEAVGKNPVGTGPFQFDKGTVGERTEAVKFPEYWGAVPKIDRLVNTVISDDNTNDTAFLNGELDFIYYYYADKKNELAEQGYTTYDFAPDQFLYVGVDAQAAPWDDPKVRQAFFLSLDPQAYVDGLFYGQESIPTGVHPLISKYAVDGIFQYEYDPEAAKALLAEAGYPNGCPITLWAVNDDISPPPALLTESQLSAAGFTVELQMVDFSVFMEKVRGGEAGMWMLFNGANALLDATMNRYTSGMYPGSNWVGLQDPEYDALVEQGLAATTEDDKALYFTEAQERFVACQVMYPVTTYTYGFVTNPAITGIDIWGDNTIHFENADIVATK